MKNFCYALALTLTLSTVSSNKTFAAQSTGEFTVGIVITDNKDQKKTISDRSHYRKTEGAQKIDAIRQKLEKEKTSSSKNLIKKKSLN